MADLIAGAFGDNRLGGRQDRGEFVQEVRKLLRRDDRDLIEWRERKRPHIGAAGLWVNAGEYGLLTFGQDLDAFFVAELDALVWKRPADADQVQRLREISHSTGEDAEMLHAHC